MANKKKIEEKESAASSSVMGDGAAKAKARTHFKIGSRKSKLAMAQSEYIIDRLKKIFTNFTFEIVNFDTKGDQILHIALPKIGDKGLFTKELEDALRSGIIDFVVHSLKDLPCQTSPENLIIAGVPVREDPYDALVVAKRWQGIKKSLDDLDANSVVGTSSLRRISQLKFKYPHLKFESVRGNLQTRFAKLDDEVEKKYDAIILAAAGLNRLDYHDRITQILSPDICLHAVSQGALGVQCRLDDLEMIRILNELNDEQTLLKCVAERTFLAKLEGGCSAPIGVNSTLNTDRSRNSLLLEGVVLDLEGTQRLYERFEMIFENESTCPLFPAINKQQKDALLNYIKADSSDEATSESHLKRKSIGGSAYDIHADIDEQEEVVVAKDSNNNTSTTSDTKVGVVQRRQSKRLRTHEIQKSREQKKEEIEKKLAEADLPSKPKNLRQYSFIVDLKISEKKLKIAELCGFHLAEKLKEIGAADLINDIKSKVDIK